MEPVYVIDLFIVFKIDPTKAIVYAVMFYGPSCVRLGGNLLKIHYPNLTVVCGVEHTVSLFFNDFSIITIVNQMIRSHKEIYNLFGYGIYHIPHSIVK